MNINEYFSRINYKDPNEKLDIATLSRIMHHHIMALPFENLSIHCQETIQLNLETTFQKLVKKQRGGWCTELNYLLFWVLKTMGYNVIMLASNIFVPALGTYNQYATHLIVRVVIGSKAYLVDSGFGTSSQMFEPLEFISGMDQFQIPGIFRLTEDNGFWYLDKIRRKQLITNELFSESELIDRSDHKRLYCFTLEEKTIEFFKDTCRFLQTSPKSLFTNKSICSLQTEEGVRTLVGWTYTETRYNYMEGVDLVEFTTIQDDSIQQVLRERFGIVLESRLVVINNSATYNI
ncbi:arylamine N-acetyltransferase, pineal gland isozyme NAT-10 [Bombina bombina]|uniref:arylamine N-acetyltransferase, pineal gland isozyme NAT-10 n=1 Tax=Bombina bombina TaxID=8345 RepID=UPI00235ABE9D|nr:arylamine N-acetyltransferase, pineal gland isozyme NAT-10 [Bombina bombina]